MPIVFDTAFPTTGTFDANFGSLQVVVEKDYNNILNKPTINGVELIGNRTSAELKEHYVHEQTIASDTWTITHSMGKYPSVTVVDSGGSAVVGDVRYLDADSLTVSFNGAFSGTAYLN